MTNNKTEGVQRDGTGREEGRKGGSGWGTRVYPWWMHVDVWQNQYNIVKKKKYHDNYTHFAFVGNKYYPYCDLL